MSKKNLTFLLKSIIIIFVLSQVLDKILYFIIYKIESKVLTGQGVGKLNQYLIVKDDVDLIVYGNSRANHNIDTKVLTEKSYNMGVDGTGLFFSATLIKLLQNRNQQILMIQLDPESLTNKNYDAALGMNSLTIKYNNNKVIRTEIDKYELDNPLQLVYWSLSYNNKLLAVLSNYLKPKYDYKKYYGYDPIKVSKEQKEIFEKILNKATYDTKRCDTAYLNEDVITSIKGVIEFCKNNNKNIIIFTSPVYHDACKDDNLAAKKILNSLGLHYYDYSDFFKNKNSVDYWKDEIHLSDIGAEKFTSKVKDDIMKSF